MGKGGKGEAAAAVAGEGENMAAWLVAKNTLKIMPFKLPPLGPYDVRVRMKAVGICGSDVHYLKEMRIAHFVVKEPMVIGHECAGIIEEVGDGVKHLVVGDRVALEPGISCWRCRHCKGGRYNLCDDMKFFATPPYHGSLADQIVHPGDLCFKLPDNVSLEEGAMCEPLSVGVHACRRAEVGAEKNVLIMGAGPIGLVTMLSARAFGAPRIVIADVDEHRLSVAKSLGADATVKVSANAEDLGGEIELIQAAMVLELLGTGDDGVRLATEVLWRRITPLGIDRRCVHWLARAMVSCEGAVAPDAVAEWRIGLFLDLVEALPPWFRVPSGRLEHLVETAVIQQVASCIYHNLPDEVTLFEDHNCHEEQVPSVCTQILCAHKNEVWFVRFSNDGNYLASSSSDCTAIIWKEDGTVFN